MRKSSGCKDLKRINVAVIILNYNSIEELKLCMSDILGQENIEYRVIIIDNNSDDNSIKRIKNTGLSHHRFLLSD